jgi:hypothetical protein
MSDTPNHIRVHNVDGLALVCFNDLDQCAVEARVVMNPRVSCRARSVAKLDS